MDARPITRHRRHLRRIRIRHPALRTAARCDQRDGKVPLAIPLTGAATSDDGLAVATTDAGWLKLTLTTPRNGGFANVMQEIYILNRDHSEITLWRTLNVRMPDGSSGKIDCGNRAAVVYRRQAQL